MRRYAEQLREREAAQTRLELAELAAMAPEEAAKKLDQHCKYCGALLIPTFLTPTISGKVRYFTCWPECHCQQSVDYKAAELHQKQEAEARAKEELYLGKLRRAGLVGWLGDATFDNYLPRTDWPGSIDCRKRVQTYFNLWQRGELGKKNWLILYGGYGTGKSHLAAAMIRGAIDGGVQNVAFRVWPEYLKRLQATWDKRNSDNFEGETEQDITRELQQGILVTIDDLDKRQPSEWVRGSLYEVLNYRYNTSLATILTFNYGPGDIAAKAPGRLALEDYLGRAVLDRILEKTFDTVEFTGPSYRSGLEWNK